MSRTKAEREMLAGLCRIEIKRWSKARDKQYMVDLMQLALAELTEGWQERAEVAETRLSSAAERAGNLCAGWMKAEAERDEVRAQLAELAKQEPYCWHDGSDSLQEGCWGAYRTGHHTVPVYARPAPPAPFVVKFTDCHLGAVRHMSGGSADYCNGFVDGINHAKLRIRVAGGSVADE